MRLLTQWRKFEEVGIPTTTTRAEDPPDEDAATTEDEGPAVAAQVGAPVATSDAKGPPDETPGAARVGESPTTKDDEAPATETEAGIPPDEDPTATEDWLTTTYWVVLVDGQEERCQQLIAPNNTLVPVDILPTLGWLGGTVTEISGVRGPSGAVVFLFGTRYVCIFPVVADIITHREGNLQLLVLSYGEGWFLDDTHPTFKPGIMLQCQD